MDNDAWNRRLNLASISVLATSLAACGGGSSGGGAAQNPPPSPPPPPSNSAPQLAGPSDFAFDENQAVAFDIQASDADGQTVTFSLQASDDAVFFAIDSSTGRITDSTSAGFFDFENPQDQDSDNIYELGVSLSDGTASTEVQVSVTINDIDGPLVCSTGETVSVEENTRGSVYTFTASKPDTVPGQIIFDGLPSVMPQGAATEDLLHSLSIQTFTGEMSLFHALNAELDENLGNNFVVSTTASFLQEITDCSVNLQIIDVEDEVTSGIKFSGSYPSAVVIRPSNVGDLDGDGLNELWLGSRVQVDELPWEHQGSVVFGHAIRSEIAQDGAEEILISALDSANSIKVAGSFPPVRLNRFIGNDLRAHEVGDIDGDGETELLLTLETPVETLESAFADRPLAYLFWSGELFSKIDGQFELSSLTADQSMIFEGLGGINRRGNSVTSGDFDGDGIPDIAIGIPFGEIQATATSRYRGQVFIVFGSYIRDMKPVGSIDLLDDVGTLNPNEVLLLTAEDEDDVISAPPELPLLSGSGGQLLALQDIDGDGADELAVTGNTVEQNASNVAIVSSQAILSTRPATGLLEYENIAAGQITVLRGSGDALLSSIAGDFDADGNDDLLFGKQDFFIDTSMAALLTADAITALPDGSTVNVDLTTSSAILIDHTNHSTFQASASFIGDIDGDGRDDLGIAYQLSSPTAGGVSAGEAALAIVLASAFDGLTSGQTFLLDQMSPGDGIHIFDSSDRNEEFLFSAVGDVDGDSIPDLMLSSNGLAKEGSFVRGNDLKVAIQSGELSFDLQPRFKNTDAN